MDINFLFVSSWDIFIQVLSSPSQRWPLQDNQVSALLRQPKPFQTSLDSRCRSRESVWYLKVISHKPFNQTRKTINDPYRESSISIKLLYWNPSRHYHNWVLLKWYKLFLEVSFFEILKKQKKKKTVLMHILFYYLVS